MGKFSPPYFRRLESLAECRRLMAACARPDHFTRLLQFAYESTNLNRGYPIAEISETLVARIPERGDALLNIKAQTLRAVGPIALSILAHNFLGEGQGAVFRFGGFFLVGFVLVDFDQCRAAPGGVVQGFCRRRGLGMVFRI